MDNKLEVERIATKTPPAWITYVTKSRPVTVPFSAHPPIWAILTLSDGFRTRMAVFSLVTIIILSSVSYLSLRLLPPPSPPLPSPSPLPPPSPTIAITSPPTSLPVILTSVPTQPKTASPIPTATQIKTNTPIPTVIQVKTSTPIPTASPNKFVNVVTDDGLLANIRKGPSKNEDVDFQLENGERLGVIGLKETIEEVWWNIVTDDGRSGWIIDELVYPARRPTATPASYTTPPPSAPTSYCDNISATSLGGNQYRIFSRCGWQYINRTVGLNQFVDIKQVGGQWRINPNSSYFGYEGNTTGGRLFTNPMPELRSGVLICRIGPEAIVEPYQGGFRSGAAGQIACRINDDRLDDNDGALDLDIQIN